MECLVRSGLKSSIEIPDALPTVARPESLLDGPVCARQITKSMETIVRQAGSASTATHQLSCTTRMLRPCSMKAIRTARIRLSSYASEFDLYARTQLLRNARNGYSAQGDVQPVPYFTRTLCMRQLNPPFGLLSLGLS